MWKYRIKSNRRRFQAILAAGMFLILLSGCGEQFPVLTQEEYDLIVDYSAGVLSKYSTNSGDKLTKLPPPEAEVAEEEPEEPVEEQKPAPATKPATVKPVKEEPLQEPEPPVEEEPEESGDDGAIIVNNGGGTSDTQEPESDTQEPEIVEGSEGDVTEPAGSTAEVEVGDSDLLKKLQSGIRVDLNGYYVLNSYPEGAGNSNIALNAEPGKKLLILSFSLTNESSGAIDVDYLSKAPSFTLLINGEPVSRNMTTLLDNEMSTYAASIEGGETKGAVLCFQIKEEQAKTIDTLSVRMNCFGEEQMLRVE